MNNVVFIDRQISKPEDQIQILMNSRPPDDDTGE
jgi:hypothetical protein